MNRKQVLFRSDAREKLLRLADAMERVGAEGVITVEGSRGTGTIVEGHQFDRGYMSPYFVTNPERWSARSMMSGSSSSTARSRS